MRLREAVACVVFGAAASGMTQTPGSIVGEASPMIRIRGVFHPADGGPASGAESVTFSVYGEEYGGAAPLWRETQTVSVLPDGEYSAVLGVGAAGLPPDVIDPNEPRWVGVRFNRAGEREQARYPLPPGLGRRRLTPAEEIALGGVGLAFVSVVVTIFSARFQAKRDWLLNSENLVTTWVDRFNSGEWEERRCKFMKLLLLPDGAPERTLIGNYGFGVLGFFEHMGHLAKRGAIDVLMIHNKFAWEIVCYYQLVRSGRDILAQIRNRHEDHTLYTEMTWLNDEMVKTYRRLGTEVFDAKGRVKWMDDFILQETTLR